MLAKSGWVIVVAGLLAACGEPEVELREWQPSDHQMPSGRGEDDTRAAPPSDEQVDPVEAERRAAAALYSSLCASCHGAAGHGDGPGRPPVAPIPDFASAEWQASRRDEEIAAVIRDGRGGFMPGFADRLSAAGVQVLVDQVRRLGGREPAGEAAPAAETPPETAPATEAAPAPETAPATEAAPAPATETGAAPAAAGESGQAAP